MVRHRFRGFSLVEVAVIMTLTLSLLTLTASYFVQGQRYAAETETYSTVQRAASGALRRMTDDIYRANAAQMSCSGQAIAFLSYAAPLGEGPELELSSASGADVGKIVWKKWLGFYYDADEKALYRGEVPIATPTTSPADATPSIAAADFQAATGLVKQRLPGEVEEFAVTQLGRRVRIELTVQGRASISVQQESQRDVKVSVRTEVAVLN